MKRYFFFILFALATLQVSAQTDDMVFPAPGTPHAPKVPVSWNRYYDCEGLATICKNIAKAYPNLAELSSVGKSLEGRDIYVLTITDFSTGKAEDKPAFYIDGNIHSNEAQASEVALYTAWYLTEMQADNEFIQKLLRDKTFYIVPTINPDGRENFLRSANTMHSPRSTMAPRDDDRDGQTDEDDFDDLNADGNITFMRRKSAFGRYKPDPKDPRQMIEVAPDETGQYELLGWEGKDNDGDGDVNEDRIGYFDPNRDWAWDWQPAHIQRGAGPYPFYQPEMKAVADFIYNHPNIAGAMTYHNYGGMLLRGPGAKDDLPSYPEADVRVYDALGKKGETIMPGYRYINTFEDLYPVYGGESDWMHGGLGIYAFTGELYTHYFLFNKNYKDEDQNETAALFEFDKRLLFADAFVEWKTYNHPQYGEVEIGGFKKNYTRLNPGFLLEQDAHRNMAFVLFHARQTPQLKLAEYKTVSLGGGLYEITATVANTALTPTHSAHDLKNNITPPDLISLEGGKVVAAFIVKNVDLDRAEETAHKGSATVRLPNIGGNSRVSVKWLVQLSGETAITVSSAKGGKYRWPISVR